METNKWEVGLVEISYPNGCKKRFRQNSIRLDSQDVIFPVKDYESMLVLLTNVPHFLEPCKKERFMRIFSEYQINIQKKKNQISNCLIHARGKFH